MNDSVTTQADWRSRPGRWLTVLCGILVAIVVISVVIRFRQIQRVKNYVAHIGGKIEVRGDESDIDGLLGWGSDVEIEIRDVPVTDAEAERLCEVIKTLGGVTYINLSGTNITDRSLAFLGGLPFIEQLELCRTNVTGTGFERFSDARLTTLNLNGSSLTDDGAKALATLTSLQSLTLDNTSITEEGLRALKQLPDLRTLSVSNAGATDEVIAELAEVHPELQIYDD